MNTENAQATILTQERAALERWFKGDPFGWVALCADDVTYFDDVATQTRLDGIAALREYVGTLEGKVNVPSFEFLEPKCQLHGDIGVLTYNLDTYADDGKLTIRWNATEVYRRMDDQWRMIHAHWSTVEATEGEADFLGALSARVQRSGGTD